MNKKHLIALLCVITVSAGLLGSCFPSFLMEAVPDPTRYLTEFEHHWVYETLSENMQDCYGSVYTALRDNFSKDEWVSLAEDEENGEKRLGISVRLPHSLSSLEQAKILYDAISRDNPQFFYLNNAFSVSGYQGDNDTEYHSIIFSYLMNSAQRKTARKNLDDTVNDILEQIPADADEFEAELLLHDTLVNTCSYDDAAAEQGYEEHPDSYTAYGALVNGKAVCEGYSRAMQLLLNRVGIESTVVRGVAKNEDHMWNQVEINDEPYYLDVTWDDADDILTHYYFNITTEQLLLSHTIDENMTGLRECTATADEYYRRTGRYVDTYHRQTIAQVIADALKETPDRAEIRLAPKKYDNAALFLRSQTQTIKLVNEALSDTQPPLTEYRLYGNPAESVLLMVIINQ